MIGQSLVSAFEAAHAELFEGLLNSILLTVASLAIGYPLAVVLAVCVMAPSRWVRRTGLVIVEIGRGLPLLVLLQLIYFGLPDAGLTLGVTAAAVAGLAFQTAAYGSEIMRASLEAVPQGQHEAASAAGLSAAASFWTIVLPQGIRIAIPPMLSIGLTVFLATSLAFVITAPELMSKAYGYGSSTFQYLEVFVLAGLMYAAIALPASAAVALLERRLGRHLAHAH